MNLVKSSMKIFAARSLKSVISFAAVLVFSRELGASPLGTYYPFIALLGIIAIPTDLGIRSATEKRLSEGSDSAKYLGTAITLKIPPLLIAGGGIIIASPFVHQYLGGNLALALVIALFTREAARLGIYALRGELRVGETALAKVLQPLGWLVFGYVFYNQGYGVNGLVYGYIIGSGAMLIVAWWRVSIRPSWPSLYHARSLFEYGRYSVISAIGGHFYSWMDVAILSAFVAAGIASSRSEIGAYENAWRLSLLVILFSNAIATTMFPQISRWDAEDAIDRVEELLPKAILPSILFVMPAFVGMTVLSRDILSILFGPEFTVAWLALIILTGEKILQSVHVILGRSLQALNRPDLAAYATVVAVVINLVLNIFLIWHFGIVGAAIATTVSFAVNTVLHAHYLGQFIDISFPYREAAWSIGAACIMGIVVFTLQNLIEINSILRLLGIIGMGVIVYSTTAVSYKPIRLTVISSIGSIKNSTLG